MNIKNLAQKITPSITGFNSQQLNRKITEVENFELDNIPLFFERLPIEERDKVYARLEKSSIKKIPLVHIRGDMDKEELDFFKRKYKTKYFTIHEEHFKILQKWKGFYKDIYLEMNKDNLVKKNVIVEKIGGFCVDLSHFKSAEEKWSQEFIYTLERSDDKIFACNHLNGYSYQRNTDMHIINNLSDFNYLKTLPEFLFGECIAIEADHSIAKQLEFKKYLIKFLK